MRERKVKEKGRAARSIKVSFIDVLVNDPLIGAALCCVARNWTRSAAIYYAGVCVCVCTSSESRRRTHKPALRRKHVLRLDIVRDCYIRACLYRSYVRRAFSGEAKTILTLLRSDDAYNKVFFSLIRSRRVSGHHRLVVSSVYGRMIARNIFLYFDSVNRLI